MSVVTRFVDCANHHDAEGLAACVHREFQSVQPFHPGRNFRGSGLLRSNWQAIFDSEPGFRLTVLRSAIAGDTVWVELHGAGEEAEVSGVFIVGVEGGRIRWIRVYSELVDEMPEEDEAEEAADVEAPGAGAVVGVPAAPSTGDDDDGEGAPSEEEAAGEVSPAPLRLVRDEPEVAEVPHEEEEDASSAAPAAHEPGGDEAVAGEAVADGTAAAEVVAAEVVADEPIAADEPAAAEPAAGAEEAPPPPTGDEEPPSTPAEGKPKWKSALRMMFGRTED
jgi:hypothetical protein